MAQYIDLRAEPSGAANYNLSLRIRNTDQKSLLANWKLTFPNGVAELKGRKLQLDENVVPSGKAVEVGKWQVKVSSPDVIYSQKIQVIAHIAISTHQFTETFEGTIEEIRDL